ncbi:hypothetical protein ACWCQM_12535 [Streptomyces sp. NPDC002125]
MRSPARLVTGTAAAALTAAALGLAAAPSAHAGTDDLGRPELSSVTAVAEAECGPGAPDAPARCGQGTRAASDPGAAGVPDTADGSGTPGDPTDQDGPTAADDPAALDGSTVPEDSAALDDLTSTEDPAAPDGSAPEEPAADDPAAADGLAGLSGSLWPDTGEEGEDPLVGTEPGDEAGAPTVPGTRPAPVSPPGTDPGSAKPPLPPPGTRPTTPPGDRPSRPSGHVDTGVGGTAAPDTAQLAAGAGLVATAAVCGALLLRRRRADGTRH